MAISEDYVCDGQISIFEYMGTKPEYGDRGCKVCGWNIDGKCKWEKSKVYGSTFPKCLFEPSSRKVPRMCANCDYSNCFKYDIKEKYKDAVKRNGGYLRDAAEDPEETPDIYCTHPEGSLNRRTAYKDIGRHQGIGTYDGMHEFDTCDRWKPDRTVWEE